MTLDPETDLKLERVVDAPRDLLWLCWTTPEHIKNFFIPAPHTAILLLEDVGEGKTRYTAIARHPTKEIREQHEQMGFHEGWGIVLDQLVGYVKGLER